LRESAAVIDRTDITLGLVAGGQGRRLGGVAKGLVEVGGAPVLTRLLELGEGLHAVLLGASDPAPYAAFGLQSVPDVVPGKGAPGGVVSLLLGAKTPWVLCVACDMPFVRPRDVARLLEQADEGLEVVVGSRRGAVREPASATLDPSIEPLFGLYRAALGASWRPRLEHDPSLRALVASARWRAVEFDPEVLDSVNTPDDLARARSRFG
jgi:molybdopterin-guanine dinucleotide biosynthesis protein A